MRAPTMDVHLQQVVDAWKALSGEEIVNSFKICGIANTLDESEDGKILCFKTNAPCPKGRELLANAQLEFDIAAVEEIDEEQDKNGYAND